MNPLEPFQALIGYGLLFFFPGLLWTFIHRPFSEKLGIIERILITAGVSVSAVSIMLFVTNIWVGWKINFVLTFAFSILIGILPLLLTIVFSLLKSRSPMREIKSYLEIVNDWLRLVWVKIKHIPKSQKMLFLIIILIFGAILNSIPHLGYSLPLHTDEWHYMAYSGSLIDSGDIVIDQPYTGGSGVYHWEIGYVTFLSAFKLISGVSWPFLFTTLPTIIFLLVILTAYSIGNRSGFGLHAAFLVSLTPSTVRFLGPVFLVPISLGLFLVSLSILLTLKYEEKHRYFLLIPIISFTFLMHPATGVYLFLILFSILLVYLIKKEWPDRLILGMIMLGYVIIGFLISESSFYNVDLSRLTESSHFFLPTFGFSEFLELMGFIPILLMAVGVGLLIRKKKIENLGLLFSLIIIVLFISLIYFIFPHFYSVQAIYDRAIMLLTIIIGLIAGYGLLLVHKTNKTAFIITLVCLFLIVVPTHANEPYYHIITESEYDDFVWIRDNVNDSYDKAILDPWKAIAFTPVTGKAVYFNIPQGPSSKINMLSNNIDRFFVDGCTDTDFLINNKINIVYTQTPCMNPELVEVHCGIYLLNYSLVS